jgi:hypothetical protein
MLTQFIADGSQLIDESSKVKAESSENIIHGQWLITDKSFVIVD